MYVSCFDALTSLGRFTQDAGIQRTADKLNMKNVHMSFSVWVYRIKFFITAIQRIYREEDASLRCLRQDVEFDCIGPRSLSLY